MHERSGPVNTCGAIVSAVNNFIAVFNNYCPAPVAFGLREVIELAPERMRDKEADRMRIKQLPHNHGKLPANLAAEMPCADNFDTAAEVFKLLCDGSRLQVFWLLCHCEECVANLSTLTGQTSPALSHHLKILKNAGLVVSHRDGKEVHYTAARTPRAQTLHTMIEEIVELSCPAHEDEVILPEFDSSVKVVMEAHEFLVDNVDKRITLQELAHRFHINPTTLKDQFRVIYGQPVASYMREFRIKRAMELLRTTDLPVGEVASSVGYDSQGNFTQAFKAACGVLPTEYRALYKEKGR